MKLRGWLVVSVLAAMIMVTGCSRTNMAIVAQGGGTGGGGENGVLEVAATDGVAYATTELTQPAADAPFTIRFNNPGALPHNLVVVEPGQEQAVVDAAGTDGNVPQGTPGALVIGQIITSSSEDIQVASGLPAGEYPYICTFPGHFAGGMRGTLIVGGQ